MKKITPHPLIALTMLFSLVMISFSSLVFAQNTQEENKQLDIRIVKKENGKTEIINKSFSSKDETELKEMLKEFDVDYDADEINEDEEVEIIIRKKRKGELDKDVVIDIEKPGASEFETATKKNFLGVYFDQPSKENAADKKLPHYEGVIVAGVVEGSAAERAGLQEGDFITQIGGKRTANGEEFVEAIKTSEPGAEVSIIYYRDGKESKIDTQLDLLSRSEKPHYDFKWQGPFSPGECHGEFKNKPFLGIILDHCDEESGGIVVKKVVKGSTAEELTLQTGDVIVSVNNKKVNSLSDLTGALSEMEISEDVKVEFKRDDELMKNSASIKSRGETQAFNFEFDEEKMVRCLEEMTAELEENIEVEKEELKENLEKKIEKLEFNLEKLKQKLEDIDIEDNGMGNDPDVIREISVHILIKDITKAEAKNLKQSGITTDNSLQADNLSFSPNPNDGRFNLSFNLPEKGKTTVSIFDMNNKKVYNENLNHFSGQYDKRIDVSENAKGVYFLQVTQNGKSLNKKIIVQ